jgi:WD40 repeat protein
VSSLVFSADGKTLISGSADQTIRTWDVASQKCLDVLRGHRQEVWRLALLPDGYTLVSGCKDGTVCFWDTSVTHPHQTRIALPEENVVNGCFTPDSRSLLTLNQQGRVAQWSGPDFQQKTPLLEIGSGFLFSAYFSPDGRFLAAGGTPGGLQIWDLSRRALSLRFPIQPNGNCPCGFLADGTKLITWSLGDNRLHEWDLTTGLEIQSWPAPMEFSTGNGYAITLSPDERSCLAIGDGGAVAFRNLADKSDAKVDLATPDAANTSFSPDGKLFAVASTMGYARVWDTATWKPVATLGGFLNGVHSVSFSSDGTRLVVGSDFKQAVTLWDTASWQNVFTLECQGYETSGFRSAAFSPDGNTVAWRSEPGSLYLWRAPSWAEIHVAEAKVKAEVQ